MVTVAVIFQTCFHVLGLLRYTNPRDGQSMLHRAALYCRHDNIELLLDRDKGLANIQDHAGNTPLHLACTKAGTKPGKLTVQTLLVRPLLTAAFNTCYYNELVACNYSNVIMC